MKTLGFFSQHERDIRRGLRVHPDELEQPRFGQIWKTIFPLQTFYVRIQCVAYRNDEAVVIFNRCEENGLFKSLRTGSDDNDNEIIIKQPFFLPMQIFVLEYQKYKEL